MTKRVGLVGYTCPPGADEPGRQNPVEYCLNSCKNPCVMPPLLAAMHRSDTSNPHVGDYISASMLAGGGCMRQTFLERTTPFYELPQKRFWPFRGTIIHACIEDAGALIQKYGWMQELTMQASLTYPELDAPVFDDDGLWTGDFDRGRPLEIKLRGTTDAYNPHTGTLVDMKSMADKKVEMMIKGSSPGTWSKHLQDSWIAQTNIYRWLVAHTPITAEMREQWSADGLPNIKGKLLPAPSKLVIQGVAMMTTPRSGGVQPHKERGKTTLYDIDAVPTWNLTDIEEFIRPRALQWYRVLKMQQKPPVVSADKAWLCKNCIFNGDLIPGAPCLPSVERDALDEAA